METLLSMSTCLTCFAFALFINYLSVCPFMYLFFMIYFLNETMVALLNEFSFFPFHLFILFVYVIT